LIQDDKGEGLGGIFGGGSSTPFGSRSGNMLTRFTSIVAVVFFVTCLVVGLANRSRELGTIEEPTSSQTTKQKFFEPIEREESAGQPESSTIEGSAPPPAPTQSPAVAP
jgi:preprotein translocase subunit SecG